MTQRVSGLAVGRIPAGSGYYEQLDVLAAVQRTLVDLDVANFLARWELTPPR